MIRMIVWTVMLSAAVFGADKVAFPDQKRQESFWQIYTSALRGDKVAEYQVGVMYERGIGVEQNQTSAALWYEKSAWNGYMDAQYNLGLMYASGRGVEKNEERAMIWLAKAARQGDKEARKILLAIIDGELERYEKQGQAQKNVPGTEEEAITPLTLVTKEGAQVCTAQGECTPYRAKTTLTTKSKKGTRYRISGVGTKEGWKPYGEEGWIEEESVEIRR